MNKNVLTWLGCSGSMALLLATASVAMANGTTDSAAADGVPVDITFSAPLKASPNAARTLVKPQYANIDAASDTIGDLAIARLRCDCNACRVAVVQLLQAGQLSL